MTFIDEIKNAVPMEIRSSPQDSEYLEAVLSLKDAGALEKELAKHIGPPRKLSWALLHDKRSELSEILDEIGGVSIEQTLFYRRENNTTLYAMLWHWESDQSKLTLKAGIIRNP